jgi:hypothetical protein
MLPTIVGFICLMNNAFHILGRKHVFHIEAGNNHTFSALSDSCYSTISIILPTQHHLHEKIHDQPAFD